MIVLLDFFSSYFLPLPLARVCSTLEDTIKLLLVYIQAPSTSPESVKCLNTIQSLWALCMAKLTIPKLEILDY